MPFYIIHSIPFSSFYQPEQKKDDLNSTDDRESTEESHGASNETQLGLRLDLFVSIDVVKRGCIKEDLHQMEGWLELFPWRGILVNFMNFWTHQTLFC